MMITSFKYQHKNRTDRTDLAMPIAIIRRWDKILVAGVISFPLYNSSVTKAQMLRMPIGDVQNLITLMGRQVSFGCPYFEPKYLC